MSERAPMGQFPIDPLLVVQKRRMDRAMDQVRARNQQQRRMELHRDRTQELLREAQARKDLEKQNRDEALASRMQSRIPLSEIVIGMMRLEWWEARVEEQRKALDSANRALENARSAAAVARREYQHIYARYEALLALANERRRALSQSRQRIEEHAVEDMTASPRQEVG